MKRSRPTPPVGFADFERISRVLGGLLLARQGSLVGKCRFFALAGAGLLRLRHRLPARPVAGRFAVRVTAMHTLAFAPGGAGGSENFHAWVQVEDWVLDFGAIAYPDICAAAFGVACDARVFQQQAALGAADVAAAIAPGSFCHAPDKALTQRLFVGNELLEREALEQLIELAEAAHGWYRPAPQQMRRHCPQPQHGQQQVSLLARRYVGLW